MTFNRYQHVERWGNTEVLGIELGKCYVFPKLDGTNASVWVDDEDAVCCGSRNRMLKPDDDNAGFHRHVSHNVELLDFMFNNPGYRLYGEWLVPHSLKTYREEAWKRFYVFDVTYEDGTYPEGFDYLTYDDYAPLLELAGVDYISPIRVINNGNYEQFLGLLEANDFMMKDGFKGEGIVIKNYQYRNRYGRRTWAKIVSSEFKEKHAKTMGAPEIDGKKMVEQDIADEFVTLALCEKVKAKIELEKGDWSSKYIGQLLGTVYYDLIREESWTFIKKHKNPTINFKTLQTLVTMRIKQLLPEVF